ncbi:hypothetical protein F53441_10394 [Fusarium austroafricanum]|uniref:gamma-glutamylcyclotransferase n=1 Tax=Fusarium austroafricanum TaxID=2364996 RepID=A0A8H4NUK2_9HYPO|nr:hypothetical protein F53441_10394 [Fusarium austroafricanum]
MSNQMNSTGDVASKSSLSAILRKLSAVTQRPEPKKYPPISSIPRTSATRLAQASEDHVVDCDNPAPKTYLYLAYGSNLAAKTFLGVRGIRPLSQVNVSVPMLELKFNLPGVPYREPCFANVDYRKLPEKPKLPPKVPIPPFDPPQPPQSEQIKWDDGLMGVVYEVTEEDYRTIIRTEGGGAGYKEIVVPCIPLPPKVSIPEKPYPEIPRPFMSRTLFAPQIPDKDLPDDPRKDKWWYPFVIGPQREPGYAQASARYLKLIKDGAKEHELPDGYQRYLHSLQPYTITTWRQKIGAFLFIFFAAFGFGSIMLLSKFFNDKSGRMPQWLAITMTVMFSVAWKVYDDVYKPIFGDGERTEEKSEKKSRPRRRSLSVMLNHFPSADEEKAALLGEDN